MFCAINSVFYPGGRGGRGHGGARGFISLVFEGLIICFFFPPKKRCDFQGDRFILAGGGFSQNVLIVSCSPVDQGGQLLYMIYRMKARTGGGEGTTPVTTTCPEEDR